MLTPRVSIIVPSFNEGAWLERTVRGCLEKTNYPDFEVVVVGDGCSDGSVESLAALNFPNVKILNLEKSVGAIVTRNKGAAVATGEVLVFIDSHQEPMTPNWLKILVELLDKPNCGAATINIASIGEADRLGYLYTLKNWNLEPTWEKPEVVQPNQLAPAIPGGCFAIRKSLFQITGGFNANLKKWGREDFEYSLRLWRKGYDLWFSSEAVMGHAFDHKRAFEISWEQVDFNTLFTAYTLMDEVSINKIIKSIEITRPKTLARAKAVMDAFDVKAYQDKQLFTRDFADYKARFIKSRLT